MNDKLCNHVNILFAAAPKNQKAEEIKEELLTNLNDKYNDLLSNGYDSTAAFHIALSGIGDIDELLKECGGTVQVDAAPISPPPQESRLPVYSVLAFLLFCAFPVLPVIINVFGRSFTWELFCFFLVWVFAGSVVLYGIVPSYTRRSGGAESNPAVPIFSKRKIVRMLVFVGLAIGILIFVDVFSRFHPFHAIQPFCSLCYLVAGGCYIFALVTLFLKEPIQTEGYNVPATSPYFPAPKSRLPLWLGLIAGLIVGLPILAPGVVPFFIVGGSTGVGVFCFFLFVAVSCGLFAFAITYAIASLCTGQARKTENYQRQLLAQAEPHGLSKEFVQSELKRIGSVNKLRQVALVLAIVLLSLFVCSVVYHAVVPWQTSVFGNTITPTGPVIVQEREVGDLSMLDIIDVHDGVTVEFKLSDRNLITVETHADMMPNIHTEIRDGTLLIAQYYSNRYRNVKKLLVTVYSPSVPKHLFQVSGASRLTCEEPLKVDGVSLYARGASQLRFKSIESASSINFILADASFAEVAGNAESVHIQASGASKLQASNLDVNHCEAEISGASRAELGNIGELSVRASGASHFTYRGTPTIKKQDVSGASRIKIFDR